MLDDGVPGDTEVVSDTAQMGPPVSFEPPEHREAWVKVPGRPGVNTDEKYVVLNLVPDE